MEQKILTRANIDLYGKGLLYEYTMMLMGELNFFSSAYFGSKGINNQGFAVFICRHAIETFLHWSPEEAQVRLNEGVVKRMKLDRVINYLNLPPDIMRNKNYPQLVAFLYPDRLVLHEEEMVLDTYRAVLRGMDQGGLYKFPKRYFDGQTGRERACICFRYMMERNCAFSDVREMYRFFSLEAGTKLINEQALRVVLKDVFHSPVLFLHESLPASMRDEYWYHYYEFQYHYRKEKSFREKNEMILQMSREAQDGNLKKKTK